MNKSILALLDSEIERLKQARDLLSGGNGLKTSHNGRSVRTMSGQKRRRHLSADARRRISEAQKKRWAARRKTRQ